MINRRTPSSVKSLLWLWTQANPSRLLLNNHPPSWILIGSRWEAILTTDISSRSHCHRHSWNRRSTKSLVLLPTSLLYSRRRLTLQTRAATSVWASTSLWLPRNTQEERVWRKKSRMTIPSVEPIASRSTWSREPPSDLRGNPLADSRSTQSV